MKSYKTNEFFSESPTVVALGCFDGVHIGHQTVIRRAVNIAKELSVKSAVWTFDESPRNFFTPYASPVITDREEKRKLMRALEIDVFVSVPFDTETGSLSPKDFFEKILVGKLRAVHIVCGFNYSFGKGGVGKTDLLKELCDERGIGLTVIESVDTDGSPISSSRIREAIEAGNIEEAQKYLGRPFSINTIVIDGQKLARRLGFPTVNQVFERGILVPRHGVYITRVTIDSKKHYGITNVGIRPTVGGKILCAETHILDFSGNLYGKKLRVEFLYFMRPETAFSSVDELSQKVHEDIAAAKAIISQKYSK